MGLRLLNDWIVIRDDFSDERMIGSIHIPEGSVESPHKWATVLAVGKGKSITKGSGWRESDLKPGDMVLYVRFLKKTETGKALTVTLEREYGEGAFLIQSKDVICCLPAEYR